MENEKEKTDRLLERNVAEQLAEINWDALKAAIAERIDEAEKVKGQRAVYRPIFKVAAGIAAAAAVLFIVVMLRTDRVGDVRLEEGRRASVKLIDGKGQAVVEIMHTAKRPQVMVNIGLSPQRIAKCDVEIIDLNGDFRKDEDKAAWIIISRLKPLLADNGASRDLTDVLCLF